MINNSYVVDIDTDSKENVIIDSKYDEHDLFNDGNYVVNPLIKHKRSPYVYDEQVEKLSDMLPECYVCFEKTMLYSPCLCKAPLCYTCFLEIKKKVDSKNVLSVNILLLKIIVIIIIIHYLFKIELRNKVTIFIVVGIKIFGLNYFFMYYILLLVLTYMEIYLLDILLLKMKKINKIKLDLIF